MSSQKQHLIFTSGELQHGFWNRFILGDSVLMGRGRTQEKFVKYVDAFAYISTAERLYPIAGDVYMVDDDTLKAVDEFLGYPRWINRKLTNVVLETGLMKVWLYHKTEADRGPCLRQGKVTELTPTNVPLSEEDPDEMTVEMRRRRKRKFILVENEDETDSGFIVL